jgi:hypothetical protein
MSYEGCVEYICTKGHLFGFDCWDDPDDPKCQYGHRARWRHSIDYTNGEDMNDPNRCRAPVKAIAREDHWCRDHYGNRYATQEELVEPNGPGWVEVGR